MNLPQRIGVFGGSFDPPHLAHQALAQAAIAQLKLDCLFIVPTGQAWHKSRVLSDVVHRLAMTRLAFQSLAQAVVDDMETRRSGPSYTVDTLAALKSRHPDALFYVLVGDDQGLGFTQWHQWQTILKMAQLVVFPRQMASSATVVLDEWHNLPSERVIRVPMPLMDISSSALRASYASGLPKPQLVNPLVAHYIQHNQLYLEPHDRSR